PRFERGDAGAESRDRSPSRRKAPDREEGASRISTLRSRIRSTSLGSGRLGYLGRAQGLDAQAVAEIAEGFARVALLAEPEEDGDERGHDVVERDVILVDHVQTIAQRPAAEEDRERDL